MGGLPVDEVSRIRIWSPVVLGTDVTDWVDVNLESGEEELGLNVYLEISGWSKLSRSVFQRLHHPPAAPSPRASLYLLILGVYLGSPPGPLRTCKFTAND